MEEKLLEFERQIQPYLDELDLELSDVEYIQEGGFNYLRVYIENRSKQTDLEDCIALSGKIDPLADELIKEKFFLEVSTPGLERSLKKEKDFIRFTGEKIKLYSKSQIEGKKVFEGILKDFKDGIIFLELVTNNTIIEVPLTKLKKAHLIYELPEMKEE